MPPRHRELRATMGAHQLPLIVASARVLPADREAASAAGCDAFLAKPLRPAELATVGAHLGAA